MIRLQVPAKARWLAALGLLISACAPSPEQAASQTASAQTASAAAWTDTPTPTITPTPTATPSPTSTLTPTPTAFGGGAGRIAFSVNFEIHSIRADGTDLVRLTPGVWARMPIWSPDGSKIVYWQSTAGIQPDDIDLYVMNADGSGQTPIATAPQEDHSADWSPDGTRIAYVSDTENQQVKDLYVVNVDGSGQIKLAERIFAPMGYGRPIDWSPDGTQLAFVKLENGLVVHTVRSDGSGLTRVVAGTSARFSSTGQLALTTNGDEEQGVEQGVYVMALDGSGLERVADVPGPDNVDWSPDGLHLTFSGGGLVVGGSKPVGYVYVMDADGGNLVNLTESIRDYLQPTPIWSPDGSHILIDTYNATKDFREVYVANADGSGIVLVSDLGEEGSSQAKWSPDGTHIVFIHDGFNGPYSMYSVRYDGSELNRLPILEGWMVDPAWQP